MTSAPGLSCDHAEGCITCGDEALPLRVRRVDADRGLALCEREDGARETVETALVGEVEVGEVLLVHAGTAIARAATPPGHGRPEVARLAQDAGLDAPRR